MTCSACANTIEKGLSKIEGVEKENVNFAPETIAVEYDSKQVETTDMITFVKKWATN